METKRVVQNLEDEHILHGNVFNQQLINNINVRRNSKINEKIYTNIGSMHLSMKYSQTF